MLRWLASLILIAALTACSKPELSSSTVRAGSEEELTATRAELVERFGAPALADFEVALNELQLAGMDRGLKTAADRAASMRDSVQGKTVRGAEILGWQARRSRLRAEIAALQPTLEHDLKTQSAKGPETPLVVTNRIQNVQDIIAKSQRLVAEAEAKLAHWGAPAN